MSVFAVKKFILLIFWFCIFLASLLGILYLILTLGYRDRFLPNTKIAGINIGHYKKEKATALLHQKLQKFNQEIIFNDETVTVTEGDSHHPVTVTKSIKPEEIGIEIYLDKTIERVFSDRESFFKKLSFLFSNKDFAIDYEINYDLLDEFIDRQLKKQEIPYKNTSLIWQNGQFKITPGKNGKIISKNMLHAEIKKRIEKLDNTAIQIPYRTIYPKIEKDELEQAKLESNKMASGPFWLEFENKKWGITPPEIAKWIVFEEQDSSNELHQLEYLEKDNFNFDNFILDSLGILQEKNYNKILGASLDRKKVGAYLETIKKQIDREPRDARFQMIDKKLQVLSPSTPGRELLIEGNFKQLAKQIKTDNRKMALKIRPRGAEITQEKINEYGIAELVGKGESNFAGSPDPRRHNIKIGSEKINGVTIKPKEIFSLVDALGEINAESGYQPELVIKEKKTIPEFGGGLCQVATTLFRAAMFSGLPVLERQSHAYAVSYYDPQGTDATIYPPHPDLQFKNDTPAYILIQTKIEGDNLTFEFYGKKDDREIKFERPEYWDKKSDGSFKASWTQIVKKRGEKERRSTFYSLYQPPEKFH